MQLVHLEFVKYSTKVIWCLLSEFVIYIAFTLYINKLLGLAQLDFERKL